MTDEMTRQEKEARIESLYSEVEELEAEYDCRLDALQDYIDDEEHEIQDIQRDINRLNEEREQLENSLDDATE